MTDASPDGPHRASRRTALAGLGAIVLVPVADPAAASPEAMSAALRELTGGKPVTPGRVRLELPPLAENGFSVPLLVTAESPMTAGDHVTTISILSEKNPVAGVVTFKLGPRAGRARVATNIRLADTQRVTAIAAMSDGSFWSGAADVIVTISACIDGG
jgi:sulfur-oxidizing protein SoxY